MRRKFTILLAMLLVLFLVACSQQSPPPAQQVASVQQEQSQSVQAQSEQQPSPSLQTQHQYVGNINSNKYHYPDCKWAQKIKPGNEVWFSSAQDAQAQGYVPCKVCNP